MRARTNDPLERDSIAHREVGVYLAEAAATTGFVRQSHLHKAIEVARSYGSVRLPRDQVERFLEPFTQNPDWRAGLAFFLQTDCPTGDVDQLRREAQDVAKVAVFTSVINHTILGTDGLPRWTTVSAEDRHTMMMATVARNRAENQGRVLAEGLSRMAGRYGVPAEGDLLAFLSRNGQLDQRLARSLARAFGHYWSGDYEACVHVIAPKVEAAARALLRELDEGIYRVQVAQDPGQYPGLYILVRELEKIALDESWAHFLRWLLLGPYGQNIRNEIAHGFVGDISPTYAALVLRAAALLIVLVVAQPDADTKADGDSNDHTMVELPHRTRDDLLALLKDPVKETSAFPWRGGLVGRMAGLTASTLRATAAGFDSLARRLHP